MEFIENGERAGSPARDAERRERDAADGAVESWLAQLGTLAAAPGQVRAAVRKPQIHYVLERREVYHVPRVELTAMLAARSRDGKIGAATRFELTKLTQTGVQHVTPVDRAIGRLVNASGLLSGFEGAIAPQILAPLFEQLVASGRAHWQSVREPALALHPIESGHVAWRTGEDGRQRPSLAERPRSLLLPSVPPWYVDPPFAQAGPVDLGVAPELAARAIAAPTLTPRQALLARAAWRRVFPSAEIAAPGEEPAGARTVAEPVPVLRLARDAEPHAELLFAYGERVVRPADAALDARRFDSEQRMVQRLGALGLLALDDPHVPLRGAPRSLFGFHAGEEHRWARFLGERVPLLRSEGWRVEIAPSFGLRVLDVADAAWDARVERDPHRWFELDLGIEIEGRRVPLLPLITQALREMDARSYEELAEASRDVESVYAPLGGDAYVALPKRRLATILATLVELFDDAPLTREGRLPLTLAHAGALDEINRALTLQWSAAEPLRAVLRVLADEHARVAPPPAFHGELRPYQHAGVAWLQALRANGLGGVLADDMGLGKTVQVLAHLTIERDAGRLRAPVLIVAPTSVVPNWRAEIARFAPELRVVDLTGAQRTPRYDELDGADVALTTYALLLRDAERLLEREWEIAVLDEAQAVKNPRSKGAQSALRLRARQRIALTGTPLENHLDELWSICTFAMPGLLGDRAAFTRAFRTPIEKRGEPARRSALARRIRPFVLRRTKAAVEAELPEKTEVVQRVELEGAQRDLYETIRLAMHERVRDEVRRRGLGRSRIVVLDALLKLRQVCCDPRLVKLPAARGVTESAKLDALLEMIESLLDDGRRVLLFSQFTSMLDLIVPALRERAIEFVELRGDTKDRATPVRRFQDGEVPLFLISLKAGGTGLNLTAADTVIHYDPWWNPAVERQATDRAHRIGQRKPVFVYKLIALGTVEERMVEMQQRKGALADRLFAESSAPITALDFDEIDRLFAPLA